jgi:hypothetical protein
MQNLRRLFAALLLLAIGLGTPVLSAQAGDMPQQSVEAMADQSAPSNCDACGGDMAMSASGCVLSCPSSSMEAWGTDVTLGSSRVGHIVAQQHRFSGLAGHPEPFPPRLTILV